MCILIYFGPVYNLLKKKTNSCQVLWLNGFKFCLIASTICQIEHESIAQLAQMKYCKEFMADFSSIRQLIDEKIENLKMLESKNVPSSGLLSKQYHQLRQFTSSKNISTHQKYSN